MLFTRSELCHLLSVKLLVHIPMQHNKFVHFDFAWIKYTSQNKQDRNEKHTSISYRAMGLLGVSQLWLSSSCRRTGQS